MKDLKPERTPESRAKALAEYKVNHVELLLRIDEGNPDRAQKYWRKSEPNLPFPKALMDAIIALEPKPAPVMEVDDSPPATVAVSATGWPLESSGEIIARCLNRKLVRLRIADGRVASMYNTGVRPWKVGARVKVKLEKIEGDPIYRVM